MAAELTNTGLFIKSKPKCSMFTAGGSAVSVFDTCLEVQRTKENFLPLFPSVAHDSWPGIFDHLLWLKYFAIFYILLLLHLFSSCETYQPEESPLCTLIHTYILCFPWTFALLPPFFTYTLLWVFVILKLFLQQGIPFLPTAHAALSINFCHSTRGGKFSIINSSQHRLDQKLLQCWHRSCLRWWAKHLVSMPSVLQLLLHHELLWSLIRNIGAGCCVSQLLPSWAVKLGEDNLLLLNSEDRVLVRDREPAET